MQMSRDKNIFSPKFSSACVFKHHRERDESKVDRHFLAY